MRKLGLLLVALATACNPGPGDIPPPATYAEFEAQLARASCDALMACWGGVLSNAAHPRCTGEPSAGLPQPDADGVFPGGRRRYDASHAVDCLAAIAAHPCDEPAIVASGCEGALVPMVALGGECEESLDCEGHAYCRSGSCPQHCTAMAEEGESCTDLPCAYGLVCNGLSDAPTCVAPAELGEACAAVLCHDGLFCLADEPDGERTCHDRVASSTATEGEPCGDTALCVDGLSCVYRYDHPEAPTVCMGPVPVGGVCYVAVPALCAADAYCDGASSGGAPGTCRARAAEGEPCPGFDQCEAGLRCISQVCRDLAPIGAPCSDDLECDTRQCDDGACARARNCPG